MKHSAKRIFSGLIAVLLLAVLPVTALAVVDIPVYNEFYEGTPLTPEHYEGADFGEEVDTIYVGRFGGYIDAEDYDYWVIVDGVRYERVGVANAADFGTADYIIIPPRPSDPWLAAQWDQVYGELFVTYTRHIHISHGWESSQTNHWCRCVDCGEIYNMNWHWDYNKDDHCDFCTDEIHYYTVTVHEAEGGTVTVSHDKAALNETVQVTVKPDAGYVLKEIRFYNMNKEHSQLVRWEDVPGQEYHLVVLPWDVEIVAEFVKAD